VGTSKHVGGNRLSTISLLGCSTSVALTMGPTDEEEEVQGNVFCWTYMFKGLDIFAFDTCMIEGICCEFHYNIYLCIPPPPKKVMTLVLYTFIEAIIESILN
jgi:hypothetical protein